MKGLTVLKNANYLKASNFRSLIGNQSLRNISLTPQNDRFFGRSDPFEDRFFGLASNLMRSLEREFDYARRQLDKTMNLLPSTSLPNLLVRPKQLETDIIHIDNEGNRKLQISYDLSDFEPEDVKIKTHGHTLKVTAKKEKKSDTDYYLKEFSESYSLPRELKLEDLKSKWTDDGVLIIEAVLPKMVESKKREREIPIEHGGEVKNITEGAEAAGKKAAELGGAETNVKQ
ncbi:unnamed protein product [Brachionus calyciflorus]|uniref:SHSP domain-containing protein n=1 Tax=Brachionus calyciflorus TaxID=104777 RepID=A0A814HJ87_9BILA|nr:unnamed protein product [Brachionus calyciflorus]